MRYDFEAFPPLLPLLPVRLRRLCRRHTTSSGKIEIDRSSTSISCFDGNSADTWQSFLLDFSVRAFCFCRLDFFVLFDASFDNAIVLLLFLPFPLAPPCLYLPLLSTLSSVSAFVDSLSLINFRTNDSRILMSGKWTLSKLHTFFTPACGLFNRIEFTASFSEGFTDGELGSDEAKAGDDSPAV